MEDFLKETLRDGELRSAREVVRRDVNNAIWFTVIQATGDSVWDSVEWKVAGALYDALMEDSYD